MGIGRKAVEERVARFVETCKRSGIRVTHQRTEVFRELARTDDHPDAETIYRRVHRRVPAMSMDTVYRTLHLLEDRGIVTRVGTLGAPARFDANREPHHHFVCTTCGLMRDFYDPAYERIGVPAAIQELGSVRSITVEVRGVCEQCHAKSGH